MLPVSIAACLAILSIAFVEAMAITHGIDGVMLTLCVAAIAGLGGYQINKLKDLINKK